MEKKDVILPNKLSENEEEIKFFSTVKVEKTGASVRRCDFFY